MKRMPIKITKGYIEARKEFEDFFNVYNVDNEQLGYLKYERIGRFKHWCWYQYEEIRMSPGCLEQLREIQKILLKEIKSIKSSDNKDNKKNRGQNKNIN